MQVADARRRTRRPARCWLASDLSRGHHRVRCSRSRAASPRSSQGWRPVTEVKSDARWTHRVRSRRSRDALFAKTDPGVPPFLLERGSSRAPMQLSFGPRDRGLPRRAHRLPRRAPRRRRRAGLRLRRGRPVRGAVATARHRPRLGARLAGDALRPRLDDPRLPARARRPRTRRRCRPSCTSRRWPAARVPRSMHFPGYAIVAPSLLEFGNDEQKQLVPAAIRGDTIWCIGMSEPNAGSDLAGLQTRAVLDGDRFVVNGQKVWTSYATIAQKCFVYVRTDPGRAEAQGHQPAHRRHGHARASRCARCATSAAPRTSPRCSSPTSSCPTENLVGDAERRLAPHPGFARARTRRAVGRRRQPARADRARRSSTSPAARGLDRRRRRPAPARVDVRAGREPARARLQGLHQLRPGHRPRPSTRT